MLDVDGEPEDAVELVDPDDDDSPDDVEDEDVAVDSVAAGLLAAALPFELDLLSVR
ncbi:MAG TPA: hypothetical protein VMU51_27265 [Mycobacteriales bacterium]|nr:hypothetical protein [Mycobacteriales bacterium]